MKLPGSNIGGAIYLCCHCGEYLRSKKLYCDDCKTKPQRDEMDKNNAELFNESLEIFQLKQRLAKVTK